MSQHRLMSVRANGAFTLVELAIVLGVIGVILGGIWYVASTVRENARITQAVTQLNLVAQNMTGLLQGGYNPAFAAGGSANITQQMITAKVIPSWAATSATQASHPWSQNNFVLYWINNNPAQYRMSFYQVSQPGCVGLMTQATGCTAGQAGCPTAVYTAQGAGTFNLLTGSLTTAQIQTLCAQNNYAGGLNSLEFDFRN